MKLGPIEAGEDSVTRRAARDRVERQRAEQQVRELALENARLRKIIKQNGIRL
jgi:hypothetical protein